MKGGEDEDEWLIFLLPFDDDELDDADMMLPSESRRQALLQIEAMILNEVERLKTKKEMNPSSFSKRDEKELKRQLHDHQELVKYRNEYKLEPPTAAELQEARENDKSMAWGTLNLAKSKLTF